MKKLILALVALTSCTSTPIVPPVNSLTTVTTACPSPSPSPSPVPLQTLLISPSAEKPFNGKEPPFSALTKILIARGETRGLWLKLSTNACTDITTSQNPFGINFFYAPLLQTGTPSYVGAPLLNYDPLIPVSPGKFCSSGYYFMDISVGSSVLPGTQTITLSGAGSSVQLTITVLNLSISPNPTLPIYLGLNSYTVLKAHNLADNISFQGPITSQYVAFYRAHRIEPFGQTIYMYPHLNSDGTLNLNEWSQYQGSYNQLVLSGRISPPCAFNAYPGYPPSSSVLSGFNLGINAGTLPSDAWAYTWDEGEGDSIQTAQALSLSSTIKQYAPLLKQMTTREPDPQFTFINYFNPVLDWFKAPGHVQTYTAPYWLYTSCMAQGQCSNGSSTTPSGTPMLLLDAPSVHPLVFPIMVYSQGGTSSLYYSGTQKLGTAFTDQYFSGGNGDGTLLYPGLSGQNGLSVNQPLPSVRLKLLREASFMVEYFKLDPSSASTLSALILSPKSWSKTYSDYQNLRDSIALKFQ